MNFSSLNTKNLHHVYLLIGERGETKNSLFDFFDTTLQIARSGNPDFSFQEFNNLGIDESRLFVDMQSRKKFGQQTESKKFFVIAVHTITEEAQNSLLKVFEEPTEDTHFFIIASQNSFLPTFLSRVEVVRVDTNIQIDTNKTNREEKILEKSLPERLALVTKLAGDISDEKKTKQDGLDLVNQLEKELSYDPEKNWQALKACQFARTAVLSRGAMIKMILENLMLQI